ncbi:dipeptide ABC transporter ATP-binding protein [Actinomadura rayongensis]|uniref:Dipeptide ABC transporter ATP-binding protein n=1 Tax=Actinomadura rayongensis TaxID=1429076 RepID=A0A6I4WGW3_9ACTN|nr:dipeptide ABC transporter ATP-binding protein [Actinomadura rayongensis]MXQ68100.1 dipeptide ABC transporter ATP-binding protein [Actinomadura rayongensis]
MAVRPSVRRLIPRAHGYQRGMLLAGGAVVAAVVVVAVFAPLLAPYGFAQLRDAHGYFGAQRPPSARHWLGTTVGGYDVLSRVIWGSQTAFEVIVAGTVVALLLGSLLGLASGYAGGRADGVLVALTDAIYAFPALLLAIVLAIVVSGGSSGRWSGILSTAVTVTIIFLPQYFRVVRAETTRLKHEPFVESARVVGVPRRRILVRHILVNATRTLPLVVTLNAGGAVATLAGLGFVGYGIEPTAAAEWGYDLNRAQSDIAAGIWWTALFPGLAIALTVLGITLFGEGLNDVRDPRLRARRTPRREPPPGPAEVRESAGLLDVEHLSVSFTTDGGTVDAVEDVSLTVAPGEILAIVGESGSGKTVTARSALALLPDTASARGVVLVRGRDVLRAGGRELRRVRGRDIAVIFQEPGTALNPVHTVGWQIAEALRAHRSITRRQARARAVELLDRVGIPDPDLRVGHYPHQFSGGQQQRIVIALALALDAPLLVADEPTTALDVTVQADILDLLRDLRDTRHVAIVLITHNMGVVADLADRVAVMRRGRLVEQADVRTLFAAPRHEYTRALLAAVPRLSVERPASPPLSGDTVVEARGLVVEYPGRLGSPAFRAVDGVDLRIARGEVLGLVGESGSGKTTIARAVAGLVPAGGDLRVLGVDLAGSRERQFRTVRRHLGFVFQDPATSFNPKRTIGDGIAEPLRAHGDPTAAEVRRRVGELLDAVQLDAGHAGRYPHELSGGQRQRAALARALALQPRLLIADEPTSALDVSVQQRVLDLFAALQKELGFAVLFISHDLAVVNALADRVGVLYRGRLVEEGERRQVLTSPAHDYTRRLIAASPVPDPVEQAARRAHRLADEATA